MWFKFVSWFKSNLREINICKSHVDFAQAVNNYLLGGNLLIRRRRGGVKPTVHATAAETNRLENPYGKEGLCNRHAQKVDFAFAKSHS